MSADSQEAGDCSCESYDDTFEIGTGSTIDCFLIKKIRSRKAHAATSAQFSYTAIRAEQSDKLQLSTRQSFSTSSIMLGTSDSTWGASLTLRQALGDWRGITGSQKSGHFFSVTAPQFLFSTYIRTPMSHLKQRDFKYKISETINREAEIWNDTRNDGEKRRFSWKLQLMILCL